MVDVTTWSETPASNSSIASGSIAENSTSPAHLNNAIREIMAGVKTYTLTVSSTYAPLTSATLTTPAINGATINAASTVSDSGTIAAASVGFRGCPASSNTSGTFELTDVGKFIEATGNWTIPANASVPFVKGASIAVFNNSASSIQVAITSDTLRLHGTTSTGTRTIPAYGWAVFVKVTATTTWLALGDVT